MPIIDPMYLYLIEVLHNVDIFNTVVFGITWAIFTAICIELYRENDEISEWLKANQKAKIVFITVLLCSTAIAIFVPTKDSMYKILIASYVTTDNIQIVNDAIKSNLQEYLNIVSETVKSSE